MKRNEKKDKEGKKGKKEIKSKKVLKNSRWFLSLMQRFHHAPTKAGKTPVNCRQNADKTPTRRRREPARRRSKKA